MNEIILFTASVLGWLVLVALCMGILVLILAWGFRIMKHTWGTVLILEAVMQHKKKHPQKWAKHDKMKIFNRDDD